MSPDQSTVIRPRRLGATSKATRRSHALATFAPERLEERTLLAGKFLDFGDFLAGYLDRVQTSSLAQSALKYAIPAVGSAIRDAAAGKQLLSGVTQDFADLVDDTDNASTLAGRIATALGGKLSGSVVVAGDVLDFTIKATQVVAVGSFDAAIAGLKLTSPEGFNATVGYTLEVKAGKDDEGFFVDTSATNELSFTVNVLRSDLPTFRGEGLLGVLYVEGAPTGSSSVGLDYAIDLGGGAVRDLADLTASPKVSGRADLTYGLTLGFQKIAIADLNPKLTTTFHLGWQFGTPASPSDANGPLSGFGASPIVEFRDISLDLGSLIKDLGGEALAGILDKARPAFQLVEKMTQPIAGLKELGDQILGLVGPNAKTGIPVIDQVLGILKNPSLQELMRGLSGSPFLDDKQRVAVTGIVTLIDEIKKVGDLVKGFQSRAFVGINFGSFTIGGSGTDLRTTSVSLSDLPLTTSSPQVAPSGSDALRGLREFLGQNNLRSGLLAADDATSASNAFRLLLGSQDVNLIEYEYGRDNIRVTGATFLNQPFAIGIIPASFLIKGDLTVGFNLHFGFDSRGLSGNAKRGIFVVGTEDKPLLTAAATLNFDLGVGADFTFIEARAGVRGGPVLTAKAYFNAPSKLHLDQLDGCPLVGELTLKFDVKLFSEGKINLDLKAILAGLKQLVELVILSNPQTFVLGKMADLTAPLLIKAGVSEQDVENLKKFAKDPSTALKALGDGLEKTGAKFSDEFNDAIASGGEAAARYRDKLIRNTPGGQVLADGLSDLGTSLGIPKKFPKIFLVEAKSEKPLFSLVLLTWNSSSNGCRAVDKEGGTSGVGQATEFTPELGEVVNGTLTLFVGALAGRRNFDQGEINEVATIRLNPDDPNDGSVVVTLLGYSRTYPNINRVVADAGDGDDLISAEGARVTVDFKGGTGDDQLIAGLLSATLFGEDDDDILIGGPMGDTLSGGVGKDTITGLAGNDLIDGGSGDDILNGDFAPGGAKDASSDPTLSGNDTIVGGTGDDRIFGGPGRDVLDGGDDSDTIFGGDDDDLIDGGSGDDFLYGGLGNDTIDGGSGKDLLYGSGGDDILIAGFPTDLTDDGIDGGDGNDKVYGTAGRNYILGGRGRDVIYAYGGSDLVFGGDDADTIYGGDGDDYLSGEQGDDYVEGNAGDDRIYAGLGNQTLLGNDNNDIIIIDDLDVSSIGGPRRDTVDGGSGTNQLEALGGLFIRSGSYSPAGSVSYEGDVALANSAGTRLGIGFSNIQTIYASGMDRFTLVSPAGGHDLTVDRSPTDPFVNPSPGLAKNRISGTRRDSRDSVSLTSLVFFAIADVSIDTAGNTNSSFGDSITVTSDGLIASDLRNFTALTGAGNDTLTVDAADFRLPVAGGQFLFDGGTGHYPDGTPASNLRGLISLDRIVINSDVDALLVDVGARAADDTPPEGRLSIAGAGTGSAGLATLGSIRLIGVEAASLNGGAGNNRLDASGFTGSTILGGGAGNDTLIGGSGDTELDGGDGDDTLVVGNDRYATPGLGSQANVILGGGGATLARGGAGRDTFIADMSSSATLLGGGGDDTFLINNPVGTVTSPVAGVEIDGGGQAGDLLRLVGGGGSSFNQVYVMGATAGSGQIVTTNNYNTVGATVSQFVRFVRLANIDDSIAASRLDVLGDSPTAGVGLGTNSDSTHLALLAGGVPSVAVTLANKGITSVRLADGSVVTPGALVLVASAGVETPDAPALAAVAPTPVAVSATPAAVAQVVALPAPTVTKTPAGRVPGAASARALKAASLRQAAANRTAARLASRSQAAAHRPASFVPKGPMAHKAVTLRVASQSRGRFVTAR
jgi:Ca2+-binding RTX toxin-like protein